MAMRTADSAVPPFTVDRGSPVPLYHQVAQHLEHAITSGQVPPGTLLANEIQLAEEMRLSRPTMRRAMQHLVDAGLVVRRRGVGTRVVQPKVRRSLELTSLHDDLSAGGQQPTTRVLELVEEPADDEVAAGLGIGPGTVVRRLVRLRSAQGNPIAKMTNYLPAALGPVTAADLERGGLYDLMRSRGVTLHSAMQTIGARTATAGEATLLAERRGAALLTMTRVAFDDRGTAVELGTHLYASSRYSFEISLLNT